MSEKELLYRQTVYLRVCMAACAGIFFTVAVSAALLVPKAMAALEAVQALGAVDWVQFGAALQQTLEQASASIEQLDMAALNQALADLQAVVAPLARLLG